MRSRSATEVPPNFITMRDKASRAFLEGEGRPSSDAVARRQCMRA
jgi:hypothetical protein